MSDSPVTHWFAGMPRAWLVLFRVNCSCGWRTPPCWTANSAAVRFDLHLASVGSALIVP